MQSTAGPNLNILTSKAAMSMVYISPIIRLEDSIDIMLKQRQVQHLVFS